jgi:hypothetical protein
VDPVLGDVGGSQGWNRYGYTLSNPVDLIDPSGESVSFSELSGEERDRLIHELNEFTGNTYGLDEDKNLVLLSAGSESSQTATDFLDELIASDTTYTVWAANSSAVKLGAADMASTVTCADVFLDFSDKTSSKTVDLTTINSGAVLLHELTHVARGWSDPEGSDAETTIGPVVAFVNQMRRERGFPERGPGYAGREVYKRRETQVFKIPFTLPSGKVRYVKVKNFF